MDFDVIVDHEVENLKSQDKDNENDNDDDDDDDGSFKDLYDVDQVPGVSYSKHSKYSDDTDSSSFSHL